jgi:hypothetical protein
MSRVKNPVEKKKLSLRRDHRVFALEGNKTFRKAWRLKKIRATRKTRRAQARDLSQVTETRAIRARKRSLKKLGVMSLGQTISFKDGPLTSRWNLRVLEKNKDALEATAPKRKKRTRRG